MKMRKLVSAIMALSVVSSAAGINAYAAAPIVQESAEIAVFNQNFGGLDENSLASAGFMATGPWSYETTSIYQSNGGNIIDGTLATVNMYDLTEESYWEFDWKVNVGFNGYVLFLGCGEGNGYSIVINKAQASLYKGAYQYEDVPVCTADMGINIGYMDMSFKAVFDNGRIKVYREGNKVLECDGIDSSEFNGRFGIQAQSTDHLRVYSMELSKNTPVDFWVYDESFDDETTASLKAKGWSFEDDVTVVAADDSYLSSTKADYHYVEAEYAPMGSALSGNYGIKAKQMVGSNPHSALISITAPNGSAYRFMPLSTQNGTEAALVKYDAATNQETILDTDVSGYIYGVTYTYDIEVYNTEEGIKLVADIYANNAETPIHLEALDVEPVVESAKIEVVWGSSETRRLYDFEVYSIVESGEENIPVVKDREIFSKVFTSADSYETLVNDGFEAEADYRNSGSMSWYDVNEYARFSDENGMKFGTGCIYYYYDGTASDYTLTANMYRMYNESGIRFNESADRTSYYYFEANSKADATRGFKIERVENGLSEVIASLPYTEEEYGSISYSITGGENWSDYEIICDYQDDGSLNITVNFKSGIYEAITLTANDANPLTGNRLEMRTGHEGGIKRFAVVEQYKDYGIKGNAPVFDARFYNADGEVIRNIENGTIYANTFAMLLEEYTVVATKYEDNTMTGIKVITPVQLASDKVELFEVTDAENTEIKLYMFDNAENLNKLPQSCVLN